MSHQKERSKKHQVIFKGHTNFTVYAVFFIVLIFSSVGLAQRETGRLDGTIRDLDGQPIPGANVTASSPSLIGGSTNTYTDNQGYFRFPSLSSGIYEVQAQLSGFQSVIRKGIRVFVGQTLTIDFTLQRMRDSETIEVTGKPPLIDTTTTAVAFTIQPEVVQNLPKPQRIQALIALTPGVSEGNEKWATDGLPMVQWVKHPTVSGSMA